MSDKREEERKKQGKKEKSMLFRPLAKLHVTGFVVAGSPHVLESCLFVFIVVYHSVPFLLLIRTIFRHDIIIMTDWALINIFFKSTDLYILSDKI